jgi:sodium/bile acid cotransporter 7
MDGVLVTACLPTTVNMCIVLTQTAGGNSAAALFNAVLGNMVGGLLVTPALLYLFFKAKLQLSFGATLAKLATKVVLPVAVGQVLRATAAKDMCVGW